MWTISKQLPKNYLRRTLLKKVTIFREPYHNLTGIPNVNIYLIINKFV